MSDNDSNEKKSPPKKESKKKKPKCPSPNTIVIHVCDENKKINKDFHCPRDLLVEEMKYFAEYLATDVKTCEEIFDWLMRYVQRDREESSDVPQLEPTNVISILISSDFLKMDGLVQLCITYCHDHVNDIIAAPCNMNCITGDILTRISELFTISEIELVKDRKDKFKSKLYAKKIEALLEMSSVSQGLFKCASCLRLLTSVLQCKVPCTSGRITVGYNGMLMYNHYKDVCFDVSQYLIKMRQQGKSWRELYWRLWASLNYMTCSKCHHTFPLTEYYQCLSHPEEPVFKDGDDQISAAVGVYPCCRQKALRFDPLTCPKGCEKIKHSVALGGDFSDNSKYSDDPIELIKLFSQHEDVIIDLNEGDKVFPSSEYNMFTHEELMCGVAKAKSDKQSSFNPFPELDSESVEGLDEDETEDEEVAQIIKKRQQITTPISTRKKVRGGRVSRGGSKTHQTLSRSSSTSSSGNHVTSHVGHQERVEVYVESVSSDGSNVMGGGDYASSKIRWDTRRSKRWNQDAQRDDDAKRTGELVNQLNNLKLQIKRTDISKTRETHPGGMYYLLENKFKSASASSSTRNTSLKLSKRRTVLSIP